MVVLLLLSAVGTGVVYKAARRRPPVVYNNLSSDQLDRFNRMGQGETDNGGHFTDEQFYYDEWDNDNDLGAKDSLNWKNVHDDNFIVYYKPDANGMWKQNAERVLKIANKSIPDLEKTFGKYYYPKDVNNRKLPIYLPSVPSAFSKVASELSSSAGRLSGVLGVTIYMVSPNGFLPKGIVVKSSVFDPSADIRNSIYCVLPHEMGHYVYAASYNYNSDNMPLNWVMEGVAEYVAQRNVQVRGADSISFIERNCELTSDFPESKGFFVNNQYWAGESFFNFVGAKYGRSQVAKFVSATCNSSVPQALRTVFPGKDIRQEWIDFLKAKGGQVETSEE